MGSMKEYFFEQEYERRAEWIRGRLGNPDADEDTDGWESLEVEYAEMIDWLDEEAEYRWLERHPYNQLYNDFVHEVAVATHLLELGKNQAQNYTINKMVYVHAVTLLEAFVGTAVRTLVVSTPAFMNNMIVSIDDLNGKQKYSLKQIAQHPKGVNGIILGVLGNLTFHNPATIRNVLHTMIGKYANGLDLAPFSLICEKRHDIVHRNGKTIDDEKVSLETEDVQQALIEIGRLAERIRTSIHDALDDISGDAF